MEEIRICHEHPDYETPLIWIFEFDDSRFWCPYCGTNKGTLSAGKLVEATEELKERKKRYKEVTDDFLVSVIDTDVDNKWKYNIKAEDF